MRNKLCHHKVIFVMLKWYKLLYYKEILSIYWMTRVDLKIKPNRMSKGALYRKMMQYGIKLSTKHPSEANNNFENSLFFLNQPFYK